MSVNKKNGILIGISLIIAVTILAFIISLAISKSNITGLQNQAENYMKNQEYQLAANAYGKLVTKTGEEEFRKKREDALILKNEFNIFSHGLEKIENEEYLSAIKFFQKIDRQESIYYEKSLQELKNIENLILNQVKIELENDNIFLANSILTDYLKIIGASEEGEKLKASIEQGDVEIEESEEFKEEVEELPSDTKKWIGLTVKVRSHSANLREEASLDGKIVGSASKGDTVKIQKIFDDGSRIWCYGLITNQSTGKTHNAWISSRNL